MLGKVEYVDAAKVAKQFQHADKRGICDSGRRKRDCWHVSLKILRVANKFQ
jgi:hypothetical protein